MAEKNHGPMRGNARGPRPNVANPGKLLLRLLSYIFKNYGFACIVVVICLFITVFSSVQGTLFMQTLIDDYIIPLTKQASPDFTELAHAIGRVAIFYACGVLFLYLGLSPIAVLHLRHLETSFTNFKITEERLCTLTQ